MNDDSIRDTLTAQIAEALGLVFLDPSPEDRGGVYKRIPHPNGGYIGLHFDNRNTRVEVSGSSPSVKGPDGLITVHPFDLYPKVEGPSIGVSVSKGAQRIAADIKRRFLPQWLDVYEVCKEKAEERRQCRIDTEVFCAQLAKIAGKKPRGLCIYGEGYQVTVTGPKSVHFAYISPNAEQAKKIIKIMQAGSKEDD